MVFLTVNFPGATLLATYGWGGRNYTAQTRLEEIKRQRVKSKHFPPPIDHFPLICPIFPNDK